MSALLSARVPRTLGQQIALAGALWVGAGLALAVGSFWWQATEAQGLSELNASLLLPALGFAGASFALRTLRWHLFLRAAGARPPFLTSLRTQLIGFSLTMTPGKVGEIYKCYLIELSTGVPAARTAPIVLFEKLMDGVAFTGLALVAAVTLAGWADSAAGAARSLIALILLAGLLVLVLRSLQREDTVRGLRRWLEKVPLGRHFASLAGMALAGGATLLQGRLLAHNMALSLAARSCDGLAMAWVAWSLGLDLPALAGIFVLNSAGALGGLSMLPGGIGVVEASMSILLIGLGARPAAAIAATLVARLLSFWLWVSIGLLLLIASSLGIAQREAA